MADFSKNHFSPAEFETTARSALEVSDGYVWIYSERPKWWTNEMLSKEYVEARPADLNTEARKFTTRLKAIERRRAELMKELDG